MMTYNPVDYLGEMGCLNIQGNMEAASSFQH
jgi:hypothetical protein